MVYSRTKEALMLADAVTVCEQFLPFELGAEGCAPA